jgi:hypothetical protein
MSSLRRGSGESTLGYAKDPSPTGHLTIQPLRSLLSDRVAMS